MNIPMRCGCLQYYGEKGTRRNTHPHRAEQFAACIGSFRNLSFRDVPSNFTAQGSDQRNNLETIEYSSGMDRDNFYTVAKTAKILGISETRIRQLLGEGQIAGSRTNRVWEVSKHSGHAFRDTYEPKGRAKDTDTLPKYTREALDAALRYRTTVIPKIVV